MPTPSDDAELREDEDPLEGDLFDDLPLGEEGKLLRSRLSERAQRLFLSAERAPDPLRRSWKPSRRLKLTPKTLKRLKRPTIT